MASGAPVLPPAMTGAEEILRAEALKQMRVLQRLMEPARVKRIAWEAEHPYRAFWRRLGRRLRPIWARVTLVWRVLTTGDCGCEG